MLILFGGRNTVYTHNVAVSVNQTARTRVNTIVQNENKNHVTTQIKCGSLCRL